MLNVNNANVHASELRGDSANCFKALLCIAYNFVCTIQTTIFLYKTTIIVCVIFITHATRALTSQNILQNLGY